MDGRCCRGGNRETVAITWEQSGFHDTLISMVQTHILTLRWEDPLPGYRLKTYILSKRMLNCSSLDTGYGTLVINKRRFLNYGLNTLSSTVWWLWLQNRFASLPFYFFICFPFGQGGTTYGTSAITTFLFPSTSLCPPASLMQNVPSLRGPLQTEPHSLIPSQHGKSKALRQKTRLRDAQQEHGDAGCSKDTDAGGKH